MEAFMPTRNHLLLFLFTFVIYFSKRCYCAEKLDIMAYEFYRKYGHHLDIGQCVFDGQTAAVNQFAGCSLPPKYGSVLNANKVLNDTRNFEVTQLNDIFVFMGLCGAKEASVLQLLNGGDCFVVDIASNLTFNKKTYIRAYVEYFRQGVEILQDVSGTRLQDWQRDQFDDAYYLHDRSYGMLEILIVEMKFRRKRQADILKSFNFRTNHMSEYLQFVNTSSLNPYETKIIRVSTADNTFQIRRFRRNEFVSALADVRRSEFDLYRIREEMHHKRPHLNYGMMPYVPKPRALGLTTILSGDDMLSWETATAMEVYINQAIATYKRLLRRCKRGNMSDCNEIRNKKRELKDMKNLLHDKRSQWSSLSSDEISNTTLTYQSRVRRVRKDLSKIRRKLRAARRRRGKKNSSGGRPRQRSLNSKKRNKKQNRRQ